MAAVVVCRHPAIALLEAKIVNEQAHAAITLRGDGIVLYDCRSQAAVATYPLGSHHVDFQTPAVFDSVTGTFHAAVVERTAQAGQHVVSWRRQGQGFTTIADIQRRLPLPRKAFSLHALSASPIAEGGASSSSSSCIAAVQQDGSVMWCNPSDSEAVEMRFTAGPPSTSSKVTSSSSWGPSLAVIQQPKPGATLLLNYYSITRGSIPSLMHVHQVTVNAPTASAAVAHASLGPTYALILWSNGCITIVQGLTANQHASICQLHINATLAATGAAPTGPSSTDASPARKRKSPAVAAPTSPADLLISPIDETQFIVGQLANSSTAGSASAELLYALYDAQFGCALSQGAVSIDTAPSGSSKCKLSADTSGTGQLLLQMGGTVHAIQLHVSKASLLSLVGKLAVGSTKTGPATAQVLGTSSAAQLDTAALVAAASSGGDAPGAQGAGQHDFLVRKLPADSLVKHQAGDAESARLLAVLLAQQQVPDQQQRQQLLRQAVAHVAAACQQQRRPLPLQLACLAALQLVESSLWALLQELLLALPVRSLPGCSSQLLPAVAGAAQYHLLVLACCKLEDIQPQAIIDALKALLAPTTSQNLEPRKQHYTHLRGCAEAVIAHSEQALSAQQQQQLQPEALALAKCAAAAVDGFSYQEVMLHAALSVQVDMVAVQAGLRQLNNNQVDRLLTYLSKWADKYTHQLGDNTNDVILPQELLFPTFSQVLEWTKVTIDAHLGRLLMRPQPSTHVSRLQSVLKVQVEACQKLLPLQGTMEHVRSHAPLPPAHVAAATQYTVELLDLSIKS